MIHYVKVPGIDEPLSLSKFLRDYEDKGTLPESYLVEKGNCGKAILEYYGSDLVGLLSNLRDFIRDKIVKNGLVDTDIKIPNLCIDGAGKFKLIDLDPNFIKKIQRNPLVTKTFLRRITIEDDDYVNYMLFQVYVNIYTSSSLQYDSQVFERFFSRDKLIQMIDRLSFFEDGKEYTHPISNLLWYANIKTKKRNMYLTIPELYDDIMRQISKNAPVANSPTAPSPTALIPTALSPTAPSPTALSPTVFDSPLYMTPYRLDSEQEDDDFDIKPQKLFDASQVDDLIRSLPLAGGHIASRRIASRRKTRKHKKKSRRNCIS